MSELMFKIKLILLSLFILIMHNSYAIENNNLESHNNAIKTLQLKILKAENNLLKNRLIIGLIGATWGFSFFELACSIINRDNKWTNGIGEFVSIHFVFSWCILSFLSKDDDYHGTKLAFLKEQLKATELARVENSQDLLISEQSESPS